MDPGGDIGQRGEPTTNISPDPLRKDIQVDRVDQSILVRKFHMAVGNVPEPDAQTQIAAPTPSFSDRHLPAIKYIESPDPFLYADRICFSHAGISVISIVREVIEFSIMSIAGEKGIRRQVMTFLKKPGFTRLPMKIIAQLGLCFYSMGMKDGRIPGIVRSTGILDTEFVVPGKDGINFVFDAGLDRGKARPIQSSKRGKTERKFVVLGRRPGRERGQGKARQISFGRGFIPLPDRRFGRTVAGVTAYFFPFVG